MRFRLLLLFLILLLAGSGQAIAQSKYVYVDSAILYPDDIETVDQEIRFTPPDVVEEEGTYSDETIAIKDTQLISNRHFLSPDSVRALKNEKQFSYARNLDSLLQSLKKQPQQEEKKREKETAFKPATKPGKPLLERILQSKKIKYSLWILAGLFILFIIYRLFFTGGGIRKTNDAVKVLDEAEEAKPVQERKFDTPISRAVNEHNYRMAVRYLHLQLLQRLSAAGAIEFAVDKTNAEYLRELTGKPYKEEVAELTRYYDYVWYGEFAIDAAAYSKVESRFKNVVI
ncbi:MAG: DUF4129 domain-containing protein [Bacteroidota bacterium]